MASKNLPFEKYQYVNDKKGTRLVQLPSQEENKDEESPVDYNPGGYLAVRVGDTFKDERYIVVRKLGWGHFSTVWLVKDQLENRHSALKVVKSAARYAETARDEIKLLSRVAQANPVHPGRHFVVSFLDSFDHLVIPSPDKPLSSADSSHVCIVFEPLGENLLALIERHKKSGVPVGLVRLITKQVLLGLQYLHDECDLVHTDIKPENIMISIPDVEAHIHQELSRSPSPTSRHVGVPLPSRTLPRTARLRDRRVQIFDSQPLSSPRSIASSLNVGSYGFSSTLNKLEPIPVPSSDPDTVRGSPSSSSSSPSISPITSSLKPNAAGAINTPASFNTPPTSMGSAVSAIQKFFKVPSAHGTAAAGLTTASVMASIVQNEAETVIEGELRAALSSSIISDKPPSSTSSSASVSSSTTPPVIQAHPVAGRSLLSQTAPPDVVEIKRVAAIPRPQPILPAIGVKIADLGNATPSRKHYTEDIQTRQYRCPEAILGRRDWGARADVWSVACVVFELLTAEYLFDPRGQGMLFSKDDDHMAQIIELMGDFPLEAKMGGKYSREIFDHMGALRYIKTLKDWPLERVMREKYLYSERDAAALCDFLEPMLQPDMRQRADVRDLVDHPWLEPRYDDDFADV